MSGLEPPCGLHITNGDSEDDESGYEDDSYCYDNGLRCSLTVSDETFCLIEVKQTVTVLAEEVADGAGRRLSKVCLLPFTGAAPSNFVAVNQSRTFPTTPGNGDGREVDPKSDRVVCR